MTVPEEEKTYLDRNVYLDMRHSTIVNDGFMVQFSQTEFLILKCLVEFIGKPVKTEEIIKYTWGEDHVFDKSQLYVYITQIRKKLEEKPRSPKYLISKWGFGYVLRPTGLAPVNWT